MKLQKILTHSGAQLGLEIEPEMVEKFETYSDLLIKWASKINLTSITDPETIAVSHFIDSLTVLRHIEPGASVLDIGAGAGFPGIPVKICRPSINLVLADSREKRVFFMREIIRELELENTRAVKARAGKENGKIGGGFDVAVARAVAKSPEVARAALPLVKEGGIVLIMKGKNGAREWEEEERLIPQGSVFHTSEELTLPTSGEIRFVVALKKRKET
ncbi:MAG: 16S rRNA (guanine(527)-N(7))-methyltransferase RsmG [Candidatus Mycalebacterium zealandia]|nr:MAG: 16S rRNA (guanine(527)-N(7))-methyltransferase RsmG [Candidatus Mycalebacterium zealandia]